MPNTIEYDLENGYEIERNSEGEIVSEIKLEAEVN